MEKLLICNCCGDENRAPISQYLVENFTKQVQEGVKQLAEELQAGILYFLPKGCEKSGELLSFNGPDAEIKYGIQSLVTCNPFAVLQELKGNLPGPVTEDGLAAVYEGKEVELTTPEEAYRKAGKADSKFVFISKGGMSKVKEVSFGTRVSDLLETADVKAVLLGGLRGTFLLPAQMADYEVTSDHLYDSVTVYTGSECMAAVTARLMEEAWQASCGKCVLCREGTLQFKTIVSEMTQGKAKATDLEMLKEMGELIKVGAYCAFGKAMPGPLITALELFSGEFEEHIRKKSCPAGVCYQSEAVYVILPDLCNGCTDCIDECDEDAIEGKKGFIHMIDQDMCEGCGKCVSACEEAAIIKATGKLPKLPKKLTKAGKF